MSQSLPVSRSAVREGSHIDGPVSAVKHQSPTPLHRIRCVFRRQVAKIAVDSCGLRALATGVCSDVRM